MFYRTVIAFDRVKQRLEIVSIVLTEEAARKSEQLHELYDQAVARTKEVEEKIFDARPLPARFNSQNVNVSLQSNWTRGVSKKACGT